MLQGFHCWCTCKLCCIWKAPLWNKYNINATWQITEPCLTIAIWRCCYPYNQWQCRFQWKRRSHWLCPQSGCSGEGEYTTQGYQNEDPVLNEATTHSSCRRNHIIQPERRIQPTRKCKQQRNPLLENKSNDGISNPDNRHSVPEPIAAPAEPGAFPSKVRIQWRRGNQS